MPVEEPSTASKADIVMVRTGCSFGLILKLELAGNSIKFTGELSNQNTAVRIGS
jgi:hypothetical protein